MYPQGNWAGMGYGYSHQMFQGFYARPWSHQNRPTGPFSHQMPTQQNHYRHRLNGPMAGNSPRFDTGIQNNMQTPIRKGKKRPARSKSFSQNKKAKKGKNKTSPQQQPSQPSTSSSPSPTPTATPGSFIVPVSHGTEKITMAIWDYFLDNQMTEQDLQKKMELRKSLSTIVSDALKHCRLFIVGSSMTGFATRTSDVDICLMISQQEVSQKRDAVMILSAIQRALRECSFVRRSLVIRAKVPILKFFDTVSGVECDLNINNTIGIRNTHLLRHYACMDWRVRPLMLFIKKWARFHDINDASKKTISSYSLTLMLIHYLQAAINPPVLPCLQKMKPDLFNSRTDVRKLSLSVETQVDFKSKNAATLGELFMGFLNYYANMFRYNDDAISVRLGRCIGPDEAISLDDSMNWKHLNIEEPFEGSNTARSVYDLYVFMRILRVFRSSFTSLEKARDVSAIFSRPF